jgi:branched-chain amino acid transport system permease protein
MVSGAVIAGFVVTEGLVAHLLDDKLGITGNWTLLFGGLILIVTLILNPEGVAGSTYRKKMQKKKAGIPTLEERLTARILRKQPEAPSPVGEP